MTIDEYRKKILGLLKASSSEQEVRSVLKTADEVLKDSDISESSKKQFWVDLYEDLGGDDYVLMEKQASSSLSAIVAAAKEVIAKKVKE
ncbi:hypothetical protein [Alteromonas sp. OM2203]|uniref:hypothetical protein n=1 Tax=Alteromonas sp. OM2203 TaxID=3398817 RepID=UPI003AF34FE2